MSEATGLDLKPYSQAFFDEAGENLAQMEQLLLALDPAAAGGEPWHAVFRCAHSLKGGAAAFGFAGVAALTHQMESLLDQLRRGELAPSAAMIELLLQAGDALRAQLAHLRDAHGDAPDTTVLLSRLRALAAPDAAAAAAPAAGTDAPGQRRLLLTLGPLPDGGAAGAAGAVVALFAEIADLGRIEALDDRGANDGRRRFQVRTSCSDAELLELCSFHVERSLLRLEPLPAEPTPDTPRPAPRLAAAADTLRVPVHEVDTLRVPVREVDTLRVPVHKVDALLDLVGELVITQAMLLQHSAALDGAAQLRLADTLADLQRHTRELQDAAMSMRMIPMSAVFGRFPRLLHDLAARTGKKIELRTEGEATELDKGLIERITDPLTHLVRNSCGHGIETPAERRACGKPEAGTVTLAASQQGGSVCIEVRDDGRGLSRERLLAKARECGLHAPDSLADAEVWPLIFTPGLSTAETVTEVSGRGVGMDVVRSRIAALGGEVEIDSAEGRGLSVRVRLPLTLAIMDGMTVRVADECYVLPLASVLESLRFVPQRSKTLGGQARLIQVRGDYLPLLPLRRVFGAGGEHGGQAEAVVVVLESGGARIAVLVDELLGQQQVVVKNLEANYGPVDNVSGATILGDGRVALIVDVAALLRRARR
ncbi:MAG TPA: chemotaxis protein CheW [Rubrivivax sp.]|nr:chemotaxis protein CheW [Rubrivivax sp.]